MRRAWGVVAIAAAAAALAGCDTGDGKSASGKDDVKLAKASYDTLARALQEHKGAVVLVDFWATWCGPCRERFPELVALNAKYGDLGLVVMTVSVDEPEDHDSVLRFLKRQKAALANYHWTTVRGEREQYDQVFGHSGTLPHVAVFGRDGKRVWHSSPGDHKSLQQMARFIEAELEKKGP